MHLRANSRRRPRRFPLGVPLGPALLLPRVPLLPRLALLRRRRRRCRRRHLPLVLGSRVPVVPSLRRRAGLLAGRAPLAVDARERLTDGRELLAVGCRPAMATRSLAARGADGCALR